MAFLLAKFDQKAEVEQLLHGTLAIDLCALGSTHQTTQRVFTTMRFLGITAR